VTEIGPPGWIDRLDRGGRLLWSVRSPVTYPSDAQLLPDGRILVASFASPGKIVELTRAGRVTWSFGDSGGRNMLDKPSLAVRWPNGMIAANDDYGDRVIVIDPRTKRIVWQYGRTGVPGSGPGLLNKPDGLDLLPSTPVPAGLCPRAARCPRLHSASLKSGRRNSSNVARSQLATVAGVRARTVAVRGKPSAAPISPK